MHVVVGLICALSISQAAPTSTGSIIGRVTADGTNAPIADARVVLLQAGRPTGPMGPPPQTASDQDGRFAFGKLTPGEYRIDVQKTGFAPLSDPMARPRTFTVAAGGPLSVELRLQRGGVIVGRVLDAKGEPLTDARVMALRRMPQTPNGPARPRLLPASIQGPPPQTNDLGEFRVSGLAPGEYIIAAMPHGFSAMGGPGVTPPAAGPGAHTTPVITFYPGTGDQAAAQPVAVAAGAEVGNIVFTMQSAPAFRVSGIVVDETGAPIGDAHVMLMADPRGAPMMGPIGNGRSDANGRFAIVDVPPGTYRANASIMMRISGSGAGGIGAVSGGYMSWSSSTAAVEQPAEIVVTDADVKGVRVVTRRPNP